MGDVALRGFRALDKLGRAGGLLKDVLDVVFAVDVDVGLDRVDVRGATGLVNGRFGGTETLVSSLERAEPLSAILPDLSECEVERYEVGPLDVLCSMMWEVCPPQSARAGKQPRRVGQ